MEIAGIDIVGYFVVASESSVPLLLDELSEYMLSLDYDTEVLNTLAAKQW